VRVLRPLRQRVAKLNGASDAAPEEAIHDAKSSAGWTTCLNGTRVDKEPFAGEPARVATDVRGQAAVAAD